MAHAQAQTVHSSPLRIGELYVLLESVTPNFPAGSIVMISGCDAAKVATLSGTETGITWEGGSHDTVYSFKRRRAVFDYRQIDSKDYKDAPLHTQLAPRYPGEPDVTSQYHPRTTIYTCAPITFAGGYNVAPGTKCYISNWTSQSGRHGAPVGTSAKIPNCRYLLRTYYRRSVGSDYVGCFYTKGARYFRPVTDAERNRYNRATLPADKVVSYDDPREIEWY